MNAFIAAVFFLFGAVIGSFLNVVIHRLPRRESVVFPPSSCPACGARIAPRDNIPIVSFLLLRGRCRGCSAPISRRYPAVEFLAAAVSSGLFLLLGASVSLAVYLPFTWALIALAFIDAEHQILPDRITYPGIVLSALVPILGRVSGTLWGDRPVPIGWMDWGVGVAIGAGIPLAVAKAYRLQQFRKPREERRDGMGMGDVKMLAMVGGFLGWKLVLLTILLGSLLGSIWGVAGMIFSPGDGMSLGRRIRLEMKHPLPFGTFLAVGAFVALTAGPFLIEWYRGLSGFGG